LQRSLLVHVESPAGKKMSSDASRLQRFTLRLKFAQFENLFDPTSIASEDPDNSDRIPTESAQSRFWEKPWE
jgi:hypothetical protein